VMPHGTRRLAGLIAAVASVAVVATTTHVDLPTLAAEGTPPPMAGSPTVVAPRADPVGVAATPPAAPAHVGRTAASQRHTFVPTWLSIQARGVTSDAPVDPVDVEPGGDLQLPGDGQRLGWWSGSSLAGEITGSVVIAGHVDTLTGIGFSVRMLSLRPGDRLLVGDFGQSRAYRISSVTRVLKSRLSQTGIFSHDTAAQLVLITCTGAFSKSTGYADNFVATATPEE